MTKLTKQRANLNRKLPTISTFVGFLAKNSFQGLLSKTCIGRACINQKPNVGGIITTQSFVFDNQWNHKAIWIEYAALNWKRLRRKGALAQIFNSRTFANLKFQKNQSDYMNEKFYRNKSFLINVAHKNVKIVVAISFVNNHSS